MPCYIKIRTSVSSVAKLTSTSAAKSCDTRVQPYMGGVHVVVLVGHAIYMSYLHEIVRCN